MANPAGHLQNETVSFRRHLRFSPPMPTGRLSPDPTGGLRFLLPIAAFVLVVVGVRVSTAAATGDSANSGASSIELLAPPPWLTGNNDFHLQLSIHSPLAAGQLGLSLELYPRITGRSDFEQTLAGKPVANVLQALPIPLADLHVDGTSGPTSATISAKLPVTTASFVSGAQSPGSPTIALGCEGFNGNGACDGVYPLQVSLVNRADVALSSFTTYIVYLGSPGVLDNALPLRVAWVVPFGQAPSVTAAGDPTLDATQQAGIEATTAALTRFGQVAVTIQTTGETTLALARDRDRPGRRLLAAVRALAATPNHQFLPATYAPVDVAAFGDAGSGDELTNQLKAGGEILARYLPGTSGHPAQPSVLTGNMDVNTIPLLQSEGVSKLILPAGDLSPDSWPDTATEPFRLSLGSGGPAGSASPPGTGGTGGTGAPAGNSGGIISGGTAAGGSSSSGAATSAGAGGIEAVAADGELASHFSDEGDPALQADQLLADLAEIYFEEPYAHAPAAGAPYIYQPREVAMVTPGSWLPEAAMLQPLLAGLASAQRLGILQSTTVTGLFAGDPAGADGEPAVRTLSASALQASSTPLPVRSINSARTDIAAFASLVPDEPSSTDSFDTAVLTGEGVNVTASQQAALFGRAAAAIANAGSLVTLPEGRIVTLTSSAGQIPITIVSRSTLPLHVRLVESNPQLGLRFPHGDSVSFVLAGRTTTVEHVEVSSRTSGDFALTLELLTPNGNIVLDKGSLTIRSTAISGLAIGLSGGALALLLIWWVRSSRRRRRLGADAVEAPTADGEGPGAEDGAAVADKAPTGA